MDFNENPEKQSSPLWTSIMGSIIGGLFIFWLLKSSLQNLPIGTMGSQYQNAETWQLNRGLDGRISNLTVSRDARIGDGGISPNEHGFHTTYLPLPIENSVPIVNNKINVDDLTNMVQQRLQKRWEQLNKKTNDYERQRRYGMV